MDQNALSASGNNNASHKAWKIIYSTFWRREKNKLSANREASPYKLRLYENTLHAQVILAVYNLAADVRGADNGKSCRGEDPNHVLNAEEIRARAVAPPVEMVSNLRVPSARKAQLRVVVSPVVTE